MGMLSVKYYEVNNLGEFPLISMYSQAIDNHINFMMGPLRISFSEQVPSGVCPLDLIQVTSN